MQVTSIQQTPVRSGCSRDQLSKNITSTVCIHLLSPSQSGVQEDDVSLKLDPEKSATTLHGLRTLEKLVRPWKFSALRPNEPPDDFTITDSYPGDDEPFLMAWLAKYPGKQASRSRVSREVVVRGSFVRAPRFRCYGSSCQLSLSRPP